MKTKYPNKSVRELALDLPIKHEAERELLREQAREYKRILLKSKNLDEIFNTTLGELSNQEKKYMSTIMAGGKEKSPEFFIFILATIPLYRTARINYIKTAVSILRKCKAKLQGEAFSKVEKKDEA